MPRREWAARTAGALGLSLGLRSAAPAAAMWQLWTPADMEFYVERDGVSGDATSVLKAMDSCAETSWMMNMGPEKGAAIEAVIAERRPRRVLEIGTFLGYMTIRMARAMPATSTFATIELDDANFESGGRIIEKALPAETLRRVARLHGASREVIASGALGKAPFDLVLMDHWKPEYAADLERLRARRLLAPGALVIADNVLFPGAPELLAYLGVPYERAADEVSGQDCLTARDATPSAVFRSDHFDTTLVKTPFEYRPDTPDAMTFSEFRRP